MKRLDKICSVVFLVFAGTIIWQSLSVPIGSFGTPGPGFLPLLVGIILALLSCLLWIDANLTRTSAPPVAFFPERGRWLSVLLTVGALAAYGLLIEFLGFIICTFLLLLFLFRFIGGQKWWLVFTETILVTFATHIIFKVALKVQLPGGLWRI